MKKVIIAALMDDDDQLTEMIGNVPLFLEIGKDMSDIHHQTAFLSHKKKKVNSFIQLRYSVYDSKPI